MARLKPSKRAPQSAKQTIGPSGVAAKIAQSISMALHKTKRSKEGLSVHVHVGDLYLVGFDEAIDAEEWGARENSTKGRSRSRDSQDPLRTTKRRLKLQKGSVTIVATEDAKPVKRGVSSAKTRVSKRATARKSIKSRT